MRNQYDIMGLFLVLGCGGEGDLTVVFSPTPEPRPSTQSPSLPPEQETSSQGVMSRLEPTLPGRLERSEANGLVVNAPQWLSETGVFEELTSLTPRAQFVRYEVQQPLFTDRAVKTRWFALPEGEHIGFKPLEAWEFPVGTVLVKQFDMALDRRRPEAVARLETRLLVAAGGGEFYGLTYRWNEGATDAEVVLEDTVVDLSVIDENGSETEQRYLLPGPDACMTCHLPEAGSVLGVRTTQLHSAQTDEALAEDQVLQLSGLGIFDREFTGEEVLELPSLAPLRDERRSVEERIRSYLDSNCSMCHGYRADLLPRFDARFTTPLEEQRIVGAETVAQRMGPGSLVVAPGQVEQSDLYVRDSSTTRGVRMPPVGRSLVDDEYLALLKVWIESLRGDPRFE